MSRRLNQIAEIVAGVFMISLFIVLVSACVAVMPYYNDYSIKRTATQGARIAGTQYAIEETRVKLYSQLPPADGTAYAVGATLTPLAATDTALIYLLDGTPTPTPAPPQPRQSGNGWWIYWFLFRGK